MNPGNSMRFNLSETGFTTLKAGGLSIHSRWLMVFKAGPNVNVVVDATDYDPQMEMNLC